MKRWIDLGAQVLLGLIFFVFGLNGFLHFIPMPELPQGAGDFLGALMKSGYFFPVLKITEIVAGALLLVGRFVPLALVLLAPIVVQIFLFHAFLDTSGLPLAIVVLLLEAYLGLVTYRHRFEGMLKAR